MKTRGKIWVIFDAEANTQSKPMSVVQAQVTLLTISSKDTSKFFLWTPGWDTWVSVQEFLESDQNYFVLAQPPQPVPPPMATTEKTHTKAPTDEITLTATRSHQTTDPDFAYTQVNVGDSPLKEIEIGGYHSKDFHGAELNLSNIKKVENEKRLQANSENADLKKKSDGAERRKDPRHNFKIEVVLVSKERSFRTHSQDISLSGTMLEKEIPRDFLNTPFDLILVNPFEPNQTKARLLFKAKIVGDMTNPRRLMFIEQDATMTARLDALLKAYVTYQKQVKKTAG